MVTKVAWGGKKQPCDVKDKACPALGCFQPHPFHGGLNPGRGYSQPALLDLRCGTRERFGCPPNPEKVTDRDVSYLPQ